MPMNARLLRPIASGVHPEAAAWRSAVVANGGSVSASTMKAVSKFCSDIDAAGIRGRFLRLNLFAGTGLNACLVPLYRGASRTGTQLGNTTDTNTNFVSGDYVETGSSGGLTGNASNKRLRTGLAGSELSGFDVHVSAYERVGSTTTFDTSVGFFTNFGNPGVYIGTSDVTTKYECGFGNNAIQATSDPIAAHWIGVQSGNRTGGLYKNGAAASTTYVNPANTQSDFSTVSYDFSIFATHDGGPSPTVFRNHSNARLGAYSIGLSLTAAQAASFYTAMQTFQTALTRNV